MTEILTGWCVLYVRRHSAYPSLIANVASRAIAREQAKHLRGDGHHVIAICRESDLYKLRTRD